MAIDPASLPNDVDALKPMIVGMARDAVHANTLIEKLRSELARLKRVQSGVSSEKLRAQVQQLELAIEALEIDKAERLAAVPVVAKAVEAASRKPARRSLPDHLSRQTVVHPGLCACPSCGGRLRRIGEDVTESLDYVPGRFKVVRHVREAFSSVPARAWFKPGAASRHRARPCRPRAAHPHRGGEVRRPPAAVLSG